MYLKWFLRCILLQDKTEVRIWRKVRYTMKLTGFLGDSAVKSLPANVGDAGSISGSGSSEKDMAAHSSTLAWKIPWTEKPGGLQSTALQSGHDSHWAHTRDEAKVRDLSSKIHAMYFLSQIKEENRITLSLFFKKNSPLKSVYIASVMLWGRSRKKSSQVSCLSSTVLEILFSPS